MSEREKLALQEALMSAKMEGLPVTEQTVRDSERLLQGEVSAGTLVREITARHRGRIESNVI